MTAGVCARGGLRGHRPTASTGSSFGTTPSKPSDKSAPARRDRWLGAATANRDRSFRGNTEGTPPRARASTCGHSSSPDPFGLDFRALGFPRLPASELVLTPCAKGVAVAVRSRPQPGQAPAIERSAPLATHHHGTRPHWAIRHRRLDARPFFIQGSTARVRQQVLTKLRKSGSWVVSCVLGSGTTDTLRTRPRQSSESPERGCPGTSCAFPASRLVCRPGESPLRSAPRVGRSR